MSFGSKIGWSLNRGGWLALRANVKGDGVSSNSKLTVNALHQTWRRRGERRAGRVPADLEHVVVHEGGQAIVGNVQPAAASNGGAGELKKREEPRA